MIFDSFVDILNENLKGIQEASLNHVEILILHGIWEEVSYNTIGQQENYSSGYLTKVAAPKLYKKLSKLVGKNITKKNCLKLLQSYVASDGSDKSSSYPSGALPLNSCFYVERSLVEERIYQEIVEPGALIRIKAPNEMGKTSLLLRVLDYAVHRSCKTVTLNFVQIDRHILTDLDRFLRFLCTNLTRELNLESKLEEYWDADIGSKISCSLYFRYHILEQINHPIVLAFDELNRIFEYPQVAQDVLSLLRCWYEDGKKNPVWQKLRLVVMHSTEVYIPLKLNQSPFNVGLPIQLKSFDLEEVQKLAEKYQLSWLDRQQAEELTNLVGGHPRLIQIALYHLSRQEITLPELLETAANPEGIYHNHLHRHWLTLQQEPKLAEFISLLLKSKNPLHLEPIVAYKLRSMGLIEQIGNEAIISCELYKRYFTQNLIEINSEKNHSFNSFILGNDPNHHKESDRLN